MQVQISFRDMSPSDAVEQHIRERAAKLAHSHPDIVSCHVSVETPHKRQRQGRLHNLRLDIRVPGAEIVVNQDQDEDVYVAVREAFDDAKRQLDQFSQRRRGAVKRHGSGAAASEGLGDHEPENSDEGDEGNRPEQGP